MTVGGEIVARGIPEHIIDDIRQSCDMAALVGEYLALEKRGKNLIGLCPFHNEKTPSYDPPRNSFSTVSMRRLGQCI